jgi:PAS domain S-box-containing protein
MEIKFKSQASIALEQLFVALKEMTVHLHRAQKTLTRLGRSDIDKSRRLQGLRTKEDDLRKLLLENFDYAIVVTNDDRRLVYANPKALDLFGVSELNVRKFSIDTFLSHCQILELRRKWFLIRPDERYGKCKISRLDGSLRVAEYVLVANVIPFRHLYRFVNVAPPPGITQFKQKNFTSGDFGNFSDLELNSRLALTASATRR